MQEYPSQKLYAVFMRNYRSAIRSNQDLKCPGNANFPIGGSGVIQPANREIGVPRFCPPEWPGLHLADWLM